MFYRFLKENPDDVWSLAAAESAQHAQSTLRIHKLLTLRYSESCTGRYFPLEVAGRAQHDYQVSAFGLRYMNRLGDDGDTGRSSEQYCIILVLSGAQYLKVAVSVQETF